MTLTDPNHVEYLTSAGYIHVIMDNGKPVPAYWAHPKMGGKYPAIALLHDWWGLTGIIRHLANKFAQIGYYVIVPDLFEGQIATTPQRAMELITALGDKEAKKRVHSAVDVVERHHQCNRHTAVIGLGMGGGLAFDLAIRRDDIEAVLTFGAFPQAYFGRLKEVTSPLLAFYGTQESLVPTHVIDRLRKELTGKQQQVEMIDGLGHAFFDDEFTESEQELSKEVMRRTLGFLQAHLAGPARQTSKPGM